MEEKLIGVVRGDGIGPEMIDSSWPVLVEAARRYDNIQLNYENLDMGWGAYLKHGDTLPQKSLQRAVEIGTIFFSGVGDPEMDKIYGVANPKMKPETRVLLGLREEMGLLINSRPVKLYKVLVHMSKVISEKYPSEKHNR